MNLINMRDTDKFIYKIEKKITKDDIKLYVYSTNRNLKTNKEEIDYYYNILTLKDEFEALNIKNDRLILSNDVLFNKKQDKIIQIRTKDKELHNYVSKELRDNNINSFEGDLPIQHKYIIENDISLYQTENKDIPKLKYVSIDIETIQMNEEKGNKNDNMEIIMISTFSPNSDKISKVYINCDKLSPKKIKELKIYHDSSFKIVINDNEKDMLKLLQEDIIAFEPQAMIGWNVIDFDFKVIKDRMKENGLKFKFSKFEKRESKLRINSDFYRDSTLDCSGMIVFDGISLLRTNFISFDDYKLDTVAKQVLGDNKVILNNDTDEREGKKSVFEQEMTDKGEEIKDLFFSNPVKLAQYNFKDSLLVSQINDKLKLIELMIKRSIITNTPIEKVKSPIASLDIMYLNKLRKKNMVAPSNFNFNRGESISGGYVIEPTRGFYEDVFVLDFKSLYPSIIMSFNIDPFSFNEEFNGEIKAPNGASFDKEKGILPELIFRLYEQRDIAKKEKDDIKSYAIKTTMNSFYGAMASSKSRFYNDKVGGAITAFAQHIMKKAQKFVEDLGYKVIYGDTDSIFVQINDITDISLDKKKKAGFKLEKELNEYFKSWVNDEFNQENYLTIELEKLYSKFFIASKKRYVGYDEVTSKTKFVGMEAIRGDWTPLAKGFQIELVNQVFSNKNNEEIKKFILDYVDKLNKSKFDNLLIYTKKITKPLVEYTKITPPHVKAAREIEDFKGRVVKYVMTETGAKHISLIRKNVSFDYKHYIKKQLKGVSSDILECLGIDFDEVIKSKNQKSLDRFF